MREFRAFEYFDGDVKVYVREQGEGDDAWRELDVVKHERRGPVVLQVDTLNIHHKLYLEPEERKNLADELAWPRRW